VPVDIADLEIFEDPACPTFLDCHEDLPFVFVELL
jgi:hypothetical protein